MAIEIGALRALLSLDSAAFERGAKRAQASMSNLQRSMARTGEKMQEIGKRMTARMTVPVVAGAGLMVRSSLKTIDAQAKLAESLDTSVESMQVLARAADLAGVSTSGLEQLSKDLTRRLSQAAEGGGPAADALERLGLSAEALMGMPLDQRIGTINAAISDFIPEAERAAVAGKLFGEEGSIAASRLDPATIARATDEVRRFGVVVSETDAQAIEDANDAMSLLSESIRGFGNQLTVALAPTLQSMAEKFAALSEWFSTLSPETKRFAGVVGSIAVAAGPVLAVLGLMAAGLATLSFPVVAVVGGISLLVAGLVAFAPQIRAAKDAVIEFTNNAVDWLKVKFEQLLEWFKALPEKMMQIGEDLIEGLKDGILRKWESVKASVTGVADSLTQGFKDLWRSKSPSRVFMDIGGDLMEGLRIGIMETAAGPQSQLASAAQGMADAFEPIGEKASEVGRKVGDVFADMVMGVRSGADVLREVGNNLLRSGINQLFSNIFSGAFGASGGLGDLFAGLFDGGGAIPSGRFGIVGERGPEIVTGPAHVTSRADTARIMQGAGANIQFQVINNAPGVNVRQRRQSGPDGRETLIAEINSAASSGELDSGFSKRFGAQPQVLKV